MELELNFLNAIFGYKGATDEDESLEIELAELNDGKIKLYACIDGYDENEKPTLKHSTVEVSIAEVIKKIEDVLADTYNDIFPSNRRIATTEDIYAFRDECNEKIVEFKTQHLGEKKWQKHLMI